MKKTLIFLLAIAIWSCENRAAQGYSQNEDEPEKSLEELYQENLDKAKKFLEDENFSAAKKSVKKAFSSFPIGQDSTEINEIQKGIQEGIDKALGDLRTNHDDFKGITWYRHKDAPKYTNENGIFLYFGIEKNGEIKPLRFVTQYFGDDWLFIRFMEFNIDGEITKYVPLKMKTDHASGDVWEWFDTQVTTTEEPIIKALSNCKEAKIRFSGSQYYTDKDIKEKHLKAIKETFDIYSKIGGNLEFVSF